MHAIKKIEFGDFQTPLELALGITAFLLDSGEEPDCVVEPSCGRGSFVIAAMERFPRAKAVYGFDINADYVREAKDRGRHRTKTRIHLECCDFFHVDWTAFLDALPGRILIIGNPPWVTNAALGAMGSDNLPEKTNFQGRNGFAAKTGKANFDISEWMLIKIAEALHQRAGCVAMLCKTSTARKTLRHAWINKLNIGRCSLHLIDADKYFGASVSACLLLLHTGVMGSAASAVVYPDLSFSGRISTIGLAGKELVADVDDYLRFRDIDGASNYTWRSGVKHDAVAVMEFTPDNGHYVNGNREKCWLEETYLFPLLKSSDIANGRIAPEKRVLLTQRKPSNDTVPIKTVAPKTWDYLVEHADALDSRRSIIYDKRPRFSVFGVGDYTFSPWKVAISGLYKNCRFEVVGEHQGKPIVLDDTCYFIPCASEKEAHFICDLLNSDVCQRFLHSLVFFDAKRPITIDILNRIDLKRVAEHMNRSEEARELLAGAGRFEDGQLLMIFEKKAGYRTQRPSRRAKPSRESRR
ncbi:MAG: SAM-dependent DNA methyltransferase [Chloroflexi bacterium]|nr:SAM-dependent DNA methyltransferase [Chloroflexota bacterium]